MYCSPVLVTLHYAEPLGHAASQMCSRVLSSHWAVTLLDVPWCLSITELLSGGEHRLGSLSALPPRWQPSNGVWMQASVAPPHPSTETPPTPPQKHLHPYSQPPAPCHIRLPEPPPLPGSIVTQLGMGDQASWEEARAWIMARSLVYLLSRETSSSFRGNPTVPMNTQTPERVSQTEVWKQHQGKKKGKNDAKRRQHRADKENKGKCVSPLTISTAVIICGSMQLPHHIVIQQNGKHNTTANCHNTDTNTAVSEHVTAKILWLKKKKPSMWDFFNLLPWTSVWWIELRDAGDPAALVHAQLPSDAGSGDW